MRFIREIVKNFFNQIIFFLYGFGLLPEKLQARGRLISIFRHKTLQWHCAGYWSISPMPTSEDLDFYYKNIYWGQRGGKASQGLVIQRDIDHLRLLLSIIPELQTKKFRCLNFGAGHGGISYLLHAMGHEIINVEPSGLSLNLVDRWTVLETLVSIEGEFDLVYGSHSLEHVQNIDEFMLKISQHLKPDGYVFFEVPNCRQTNCENLLNGGQDGKIRPPHTYYFTTDYFNSLSGEPLLISTFHEERWPNILASKEDGEVIRYLGRGKP